VAASPAWAKRGLQRGIDNFIAQNVGCHPKTEVKCVFCNHFDMKLHSLEGIISDDSWKKGSPRPKDLQSGSE
jgi:hypothetical protein